MRDKTLLFLLVCGVLTLLRGLHAHAGECRNAEFCKDPCPAENSCRSDADCAKPLRCRPGCVPSSCVCNPDTGEWAACTTDCAWECAEPPEHANPPRYVIIELGTLGGWSSVALGINERGQVVGGADTHEGWRHAYLWESGKMTDLGTIGGPRQSGAWDINELGQVVGTSSNTGDPGLAFLWLPEPAYGLPAGMNDLGHLVACCTSAYALNDAGQVVGISKVSVSVSHAFLWENGTMTDLGAFGGDRSLAWDVNNAAHVVGRSSTDGSPGGAFLWESGTMKNLGTLGGGGSLAFGINDLRQVVGQAQRSGDPLGHAFEWANGEMVDLGAIGGFSSSGTEAINDRGQVIGWPQFLYDPKEGMLDLEYLLPPGSPWYQLIPRDINNLAQIVGAGTFQGRRRAFLMTPIDGDFNDDGDTDLTDLAMFVCCLSGPCTRLQRVCSGRDINRDGKLDLVDFQAFQWVFDGP